MTLRFDLPDESEIPSDERCSSCNHALERHDFMRCLGSETDPFNGICGCELFDDRAFVARMAMIYALKQLKGASKYDVRTLDEAHNWLDNEIYLLENPERPKPVRVLDPTKKRKNK